MQKKLYRNQLNGKITGVCSGLSEYLDMDVTLIRVLAILLAITGPGIVLYLVASIILHNKPRA